jgi:hypothetical protein
VSADPKPVSADEINALILSSFPSRRERKIAVVIDRVAHALEHQKRAIPDAVIFERLRLLVIHGVLVATADTSRWRRCEVRPVGRRDREADIIHWVHDLEKTLPIEEVIECVRSLRDAADAEERGSF